MDVDHPLLWLRWGILVFALLTSMGLGKLIVRLRIRHRRRIIDKLLESVPDVLYKEPPPPAASADAAAGADDDDRDACVICQMAYEVGERCFVLPKCKHMFHKDCIATWLRKRVTCPLCRATVVAVAVVVVKEQQSQLNAAENMV